MRTRILSVLIMVTLIMLFSCKKESEPATTGQKTPGSFRFIALGNTQKSTILKALDESSATGFDFGNLKASKEFYFILTNGGDEPIFDIAITTDNESFTVMPSNIAYLPGGFIINNEENTGLIPIITLGIRHGTQLNGVGYTALLPMGMNSASLVITGKTMDNADTVTISSSFDLSVNAKVMDIKLYDNSGEIDLTNSTHFISSGLGGLGFIRLFTAAPASPVSLKNTGNVVISINYGDPESQNNLITVQPSDSIELVTYFSPCSLFILDSQGTISDNHRIQMGNDGRGYFGIMYWNK